MKVNSTLKKIGRIFLFFSFIAIGIYIYTVPKPESDLTLLSPINNFNYLKPYFSSKSVFEGIYSNVDSKGNLPANAVVVSHHFLTANDIARTLELVDKTNLKKIIVLGPDHFSKLDSKNLPLATTSLHWDTPFGVLRTSKIAIDEIVEYDDTIFKQEHSVYTLIPFIKMQFPDVEVIPLVLNLNASQDQLTKAGNELSKINNSNDTLLIISSDFTHGGNNLGEVKIKDGLSINDFRTGSFDKTAITSDCNKCFELLKSYLANTDSSFYLAKNSNSTEYGGTEDNITSYVFGLFVDNIRIAQINFVGDLMFDRSIREVGEKNGYEYIFSKIKPVLLSSDINVGNLEGPITTKNSISKGSVVGSRENYIFTFSPAILSILKSNKFTLLNIGNNHILNFGSQGLISTQEYLNSGEIEYFGDISTHPEVTNYAKKNLGNYTIAFVNFNEFGGADMSNILKNIQDLSSTSDFVFVYTHWGIEYLPLSPKDIQDRAHQFIDSGADVVIGSHPHVVQQKEEYKGKTIYYSLGNFVMDQYFSEEVMQGLVVKVFIDSEKNLIFEEVKTTMSPEGLVKFR